MHSPRRYLYLLSYFIHPGAPKYVFSNQYFGLSFPDFAFEMKYSLTSQWHKHWFLLRDCTLIDCPVVSCSITVNYLIKQTLLLFGWSKALSVNSLWIPQAGKRKLSLTERAPLALVFWWNEKKIAWRWAPGISRETTGFNLIWEVVWGITFIWLGNHQGPGCLLS